MMVIRAHTYTSHTYALLPTPPSCGIFFLVFLWRETDFRYPLPPPPPSSEFQKGGQTRIRGREEEADEKPGTTQQRTTTSWAAAALSLTPRRAPSRAIDPMWPLQWRRRRGRMRWEERHCRSSGERVDESPGSRLISMVLGQWEGADQPTEE